MFHLWARQAAQMCSGFWFYLKLALVRGKGLAELALAAGLELDHCPQRHRGLTLLEVNSSLEVGSEEGPPFVCAL